MAQQIFVLAFVQTEWRGTEKIFERRENVAAFTDVAEAYKVAEEKATCMEFAYTGRGFDTDDSEVTIGLLRYKNKFINGTWNFYVDELTLD